MKRSAHPSQQAISSSVCTTFSPIPTVKAFGIFGSLLIIVDYIQVITWYVLVTTTMLSTMLEHARQPQS